MQLISVGVFNHEGKLRKVDFQIGQLNILTGKSKTGKSAIIDIVEYCLGRDTVTIPEGVISDVASWYYVIVQFSEERVLICRPNPGTASTNRAMINIGGLDLTPPKYAELIVNADTDVVSKILTERLNIEQFTIEPADGSLRNPFEVSVRQALMFNFQSQGEIASREVLFHRQTENYVKLAIRDSLPYFLGAATPEQTALQRRILAVRRSLQRTQNRIRASETDRAQRDDRVTHLIESAVALNIFPTGSGLDADSNITHILELIAAYRSGEDSPEDYDQSRKRSELDDKARGIRHRLRELDDHIELLRRINNEQTQSQQESMYQGERLRAMDLLVPKSALSPSDVTFCPLCDQKLDHPDESMEDLQTLLADLEDRLIASRGMSTRRQSVITKLQLERSEIIDDLRVTMLGLDVLSRQEDAISAGRQRNERIAFLQGRVSQELERNVDFVDQISELHESERRYQGQLTRLEELYEKENPSVALREAIDAISAQLTDYARYLRLEGSEYFAYLDPTRLTVEVRRPGGRVPLRRMGSAENWVGYHLATHLALHHWFTTNGRPVPRFLMLDQPTQAFFPEEVIDASSDENADWEAVRAQFSLMRDVVMELDGNFQIIVCDHANLADEWFQNAVVDNWRNGVALIPSDWLEDLQ